MSYGLIWHLPGSMQRPLMTEAKQDDLYSAGGYLFQQEGLKVLNRSPE